VVVCALIYAFQLGIAEPEFHYQKAAAQALPAGSGNSSAISTAAFAAGNYLALPLMHAQNYSVRAVFEGTGRPASIRMLLSDPELSITRIAINGKEACSPCNLSAKYPLQLEEGGSLEALVETERRPLEIATKQNSRSFFKTNVFTFVEPLLLLEVSGGWQATANGSIPASFYGVDAPFHIARIPVLAEYLSRAQWPYERYSFISILPAALLYMASGITPQYAFRIYEILLFFMPVALFYFFSRKLGRGRDAVFMFSSLLYFYLPSNGMLIGGGPDLFFYGMMPHTLATYLSLAFFYFAYEYALGKAAGAFLPAAASFGLAFLSNPRILPPLLAILVMVGAAALAAGRLRRAALLGAACLAASAWSALPFFQSLKLAEYSALGGVKISSSIQAVFTFLGTGYLVLPALALAGAWAAFKRNELLAILLGAAALAVFLAATSPQLNQAFPFLDGIRLLPSFFLPVFFLGGLGAQWLWEQGKNALLKAQAHFKMDDLTFGGAVAFAILAPLAILFATAMLTASDQYRSIEKLPALAAERDFFEKSEAATGGGFFFFIPISYPSHYPAMSRDFYSYRSYNFDYANASGLAEKMGAAHIRYAVLGSAKAIENNSEKSRQQEYDELLSDPRFAEIIPIGTERLFELKGADAASPLGFYSEGARVQESEVRFDRARLRGECLRDSCWILVYNHMPLGSKCLSSQGSCAVEADNASGLAKISGIGRGSFEVATEPEPPGYFFPLSLLCAAALAGSFALARKESPD